MDTVALLALANRDDELHDKAKKVYAQLATERSTLITSQWVLTEFLGGASRIPLRGAAIRVVERLMKSRRTQIVPVSAEAWAAAYLLYKARPDKEWSLVDCSSVLICQDRGVADVLTADHFSPRLV
jgi:predicted nucleic acid-binding protein